ncbi:hypothetical protein FKW77_008493 [Venturia effusa]|uniref:BRCT domain-containing protein n=1 Tax=Venturia effusa TaxID=50376 RepID=A0A517LKP4_9PEZI|nr:hypothetical protein FKW77_008493 [Venturia effusa]
MAVLVDSSKPFPDHVAFLWTDNLKDVSGARKQAIGRGRTIISRTFAGDLIIGPDAQEESQRAPVPLASINAEEFIIGEEKESHIQLELTALIPPYIYVRRPDRSTVILRPETDPVKCCALSHGDAIHFLDPNVSIVVKMRLEDVQVASSAAEPVVNANAAVKTRKYIGPLALNVLGTPDIAFAVDQVAETPISATIPQSPKSANSDTSDGRELPESYLANLDSQPRRPSITTTIASNSRKRQRDEDADSEAEKSAKKPRDAAQNDGAPERVSTIDEDEPDFAAPAQKRRGRPKKGTIKSHSSKPSSKNAVGTPKSERDIETATPRSSARSTTSKSNGSPSLSSFDDAKPTVVFSGSNFKTLIHQKSLFAKVATVKEIFDKNTTLLCIGGGLKKMPKILSAVALGKPIVSDKWAQECAKAKGRLDIELFLARDEETEKKWGVPERWSAGESPCEDMLKGHTLYVTPSLKNDYGQGFKAIEDLAKLVGVKKVVSKPSRAAPPDEENVILMGLAKGDLDAVALHAEGRKIYEKDLLPISILRGELCLDDFETVPQLGISAVNKRGGKKAKK